MCTVSFVSSNGKTIITSNRDEKVHRPSAIEPKSYRINNKTIFFPKDQKAGGTWYAVREDGTVLVLLNGAAEKHQLKPSYRKSRGLIVLEVISADSVLEAWNELNLADIEPFTLVLFYLGNLYQLRWNETEKSTVQLDVHQKHIWSSSTLYPKEIREHRVQLFHQFLDDKTEVNSAQMHDFHRYTEDDNPENGLVINRNEVLKTLSITQTVIEQNKVVLSHYDLQQQKSSEITFIVL
jgi:uncharacterized protein with NRDE domain